MSDRPYAIPTLSQIGPATLRALEFAATGIARLDERIDRLGLIGRGYRARIEFQEACALRGLFGELVLLEDLVLTDAGAPIRMPTAELGRARRVLAIRRAADRQLPAWAWSDDALFGDRLDVDKDKLLIALGDDVWDEDARVDQWREAIVGTSEYPPALRAAIAWDAWLQLEPISGEGWRASVLAASFLRADRVARHHLPVIGIGGRRSKVRFDLRDPANQRIACFCDWVQQAVEAAEREIQRLVLADQLLRQVGRQKHGDSRLPALIELFTSTPVVSAELAKSRLKLSSSGFRHLRESLGTSIREMSGRGRYRVWGLA